MSLQIILSCHRELATSHDSPPISVCVSPNGVREELKDLIGQMSAYALQEVDEEPLRYSYRVGQVAGTDYHLLCRSVMTGDQAKIRVTHALLLSQEEVAILHANAARPTPAGIMLALENKLFWRSELPDSATVLDTEPTMTASALPNASTQALWKRYTGHKGNARALFTPPYDGECVLVFPPGTRQEEVLGLLNESDWLTADRGWGHTFTTLGTRLSLPSDTSRIAIPETFPRHAVPAWADIPVLLITPDLVLGDPGQVSLSQKDERGAEHAPAPYHYVESDDNDTYPYTRPPLARFQRLLIILGGLLLLSFCINLLVYGKVDEAGALAGKAIAPKELSETPAGVREHAAEFPPPAPTEVAPSPAPTEVAPPSAPTEAAPPSAPTEVAPSPAPTEVAPPSAPTEVAPSPAPTEEAPPSAPTEVAPPPAPTEVAPLPAVSEKRLSPEPLQPEQAIKQEPPSPTAPAPPSPHALQWYSVGQKLPAEVLNRLSHSMADVTVYLLGENGEAYHGALLPGKSPHGYRLWGIRKELNIEIVCDGSILRDISHQRKPAAVLLKLPQGSLLLLPRLRYRFGKMVHPPALPDRLFNIKPRQLRCEFGDLLYSGFPTFGKGKTVFTENNVSIVLPDLKEIRHSIPPVYVKGKMPVYIRLDDTARSIRECYVIPAKLMLAYPTSAEMNAWFREITQAELSPQHGGCTCATLFALAEKLAAMPLSEEELRTYACWRGEAGKLLPGLPDLSDPHGENNTSQAQIIRTEVCAYINNSLSRCWNEKKEQIEAFDKQVELQLEKADLDDKGILRWFFVLQEEATDTHEP